MEGLAGGVNRISSHYFICVLKLDLGWKKKRNWASLQQGTNSVGPKEPTKAAVLG